MKRKNIGLTIVAVLLILSNIGGIYKISYSTDMVSRDYPFLTVANAPYIVLVPIISIVGLVGVLYGKRWGLIISTLAFVLILSIDVVYAVWPHVTLVIVGFTILMFFCWRSGLFFRNND